MAFTRRMAALSAVVLIPLGIAATSFALSDRPEPAKAPSEVVLDSGSPTPKPTPTPKPEPTPDPSPDDEVVPRQPVTDSPTMDDDDDDRGRGAGDDGNDDDGPGDAN